MTILDRIYGLCGFQGPLTKAEAQRWATARTLDDLGELTARWLSGDIASQPGYYGRVDVDEDIAPGLTATLIALNLRGFVTEDSQAGSVGPGLDDAQWAQHAAVDGFATNAALAEIRQAIAGTRFRIVAHRCKSGRGKALPGVFVTYRDGAPHTRYGQQMSRRDICEWHDEGYSSEALEALSSAWQLTVYDPDPGANELWSVLGAAMEKVV